jgi:uncharacterized protein (DUF2235 family)
VERAERDRARTVRWQMARKLVLISDGTGNSSAKAEKTNVWRLFECLDQRSGDQLAHYDDGVGTSANKYLAALGGAFGWGLSRNVIDLYKFVCRNYESGDEIFGFGFSRGSYTIRMVVGLIASQGLVPSETEEQLDRRASAAFRAYRWEKHWKWHHLLLPARVVLGVVLWLKDLAFGDGYDATDNVRSVSIRFLGLWDTVAAYEMPVVEIKRAMDFWLWPMSFSNCSLSPIVTEAVHALSLDDQRETFHPMLWDEEEEVALAKAGTVKRGRLTQVWFAGVHSNVGGGYPEDRLSFVPFGWIAEHARQSGLRFNVGEVEAIAAEASPFARLYDSRAGAGAFYRYAPRQIPYEPALIHESVIMRMADGSDRYAPVSLPEHFGILDSAGDVVTLGQVSSLAANAATKPLADAMAKLTQASKPQLELIWDTVWWRRVVYFVTMACASMLLVYPLVAGFLSHSVGAQRADAVYYGLVSNLVDALSALIPDYFSWWLDSLSEHPLVFAVIAAGLGYSLYFGHLLGTRIADRASHAWHQQAGPAMLEVLRRRELGAAGILGTLAAVALAMLVYGQWGSDWSREARTMWAILFSTLAVMAKLRLNAANRLQIIAAGGGPRGGVALKVARFLRTWRLTVKLSEIFVRGIVPFVFLILLGYVFFALLNRVVVDVGNSLDAGCGSTVAVSKEKTGDATGEFTTSDRCWATGLFLEKGGRYRITLKVGEDWFDADHRADPSGFGSDTLAHLLGSVFRRSWRADWLQPIARIGVVGNDEYVLDPVTPFVEHRYQSKWWPKAIGIPAALDPQAAKRAAGSDPTPEDRRELVSDITARTTGELFLYANDVAVPFDNLSKRFRDNNLGTASVTVRRVRPGD